MNSIATLDTPDSLNTDPNALPPRCEVLIVGAGPAGSAAAITLARAGLDVVLVDQHSFPRDKICGDGLIPDAHNALRKLGVLDAVLAQAQAASHVGCIGPRGGRIDVPGTLSVLPRKTLDLILCRAAVAAGARMFAPVRFSAPIEDKGRVVGAQLKSGEKTHDLRAPWVLLAYRLPREPSTPRIADDARAAEHGSPRRAPRAEPGLRLDLPVPRRRVQCRRGHRRQP